MSDLDSLLDQLTTDVPAGQAVDLDGLMDEIEVQTPKKQTGAKKGKEVEPDDLDSLIGDLTLDNNNHQQQPIDEEWEEVFEEDEPEPEPEPPKPQPKQAPALKTHKPDVSVKQEKLDDDLDSLIGDLIADPSPAPAPAPSKQPSKPASEPKKPTPVTATKSTAKPSPSPNPSSAITMNTDFLDDLMGDLTAGSTAPGKVGLKGHAAAQKAAAAQPPAQQQKGKGAKAPVTLAGDSDQVEDLESLMDDLTGQPPQQQPKQQPKQQQQQPKAQPKQQPANKQGNAAPRNSPFTQQQDSELDAIMAEIDGAKGKPNEDGNDLIAFLGQLESTPPTKQPAAKSAVTKQPAKQPSTAPSTQQPKGGAKPAARGGALAKDLESLVSTLTAPGSELDDLMNDIASPQPQSQPRNDELEDLMNDFDAQPTSARRQAPPPQKAATTGQTRRQQSNFGGGNGGVADELEDINNLLDQPVRVESGGIQRGGGGGGGAQGGGMARGAQGGAMGGPQGGGGMQRGGAQGGGMARGAQGGAMGGPQGGGMQRGGAQGGGMQRGGGGMVGGGGDGDLDSILTGLNDTNQTIQPARGGPQRTQEVLPKGICSGCRKPVTGEAVHALGRSYHPDHFMCSTCGKVIGNGAFYEKEGQPQCDRCYQSVFCKRCANCNLPITNQLVTALGQPWHPKCFVCTDCGQNFAGGQFFERDGRPFCNNCFYNVFSSRCRKCNKAIGGAVINALGSAWHSEHFTCFACNAAFPDGQFWELDGLPYCETHYRQMLDQGY